jgi:DDE domain
VLGPKPLVKGRDREGAVSTYGSAHRSRVVHKYAKSRRFSCRRWSRTPWSPEGQVALSSSFIQRITGVPSRGAACTRNQPFIASSTTRLPPCAVPGCQTAEHVEFPWQQRPTDSQGLETIREWSLRFGRTYAKRLKRRRPQPGDKWFLDDVFVRIRGKLHYLWRAVDQDSYVLDVLLQSRRNTKAAKRFFRKLLKDLCYVPRVIVTDKL